MTIKAKKINIRNRLLENQYAHSDLVSKER